LWSVIVLPSGLFATTNLSPTVTAYPTIEAVNNLVRVFVNDTFAGLTNTVGEGRIYTDSWTPNITILNAALQHLQRDLENYGMPTTREVVFIIGGLTPIYGPGGLGIPDPTVQVSLGFNGYWNGSGLNQSIALPYDLMVPIEIKQRVTNSGTVFTELANAIDDLPSVDQNYLLGWWTWRGNAIYFNGSQNTMDIQLRYTGGIPVYPTTLSPTLFSQTIIPFLDATEALAYRCAYIFCSPRLPKDGASELKENYEYAMLQMANRWIKTAQRTPVSRRAFGGEGGAGASGDGWC
jgi:hypothetical protein